MPSFHVLKTQHTRFPGLFDEQLFSKSEKKSQPLAHPLEKKKWAEPIAELLVLGGHTGLQLSTGGTARSDKMQELPLYVSQLNREHAFSMHMIQRQLNSGAWERNFKTERP